MMLSGGTTRGTGRPSAQGRKRANSRGRGELPPDNAARIAIYDVMAAAGARRQLTEDEIFARSIPRLRVLVPRERHISGELPYVREKIRMCVQAGLLEPVPDMRDQ